MAYDREEWEEKSFQVFTDENGVLRSGWYPTGNGTVTGNVRVDRVWGNLPLQPNEDRTDTFTPIGGGQYDVGWSNTFTYTSDTLQTSPYNYTDAWQDLFDAVVRTPADSHTIATTGYSNYPGYIENYAGDGDADLEAVVPNVRGMLRTPGSNLILAAGLEYMRTSINYDVVAVESTGNVVTVVTDGDHELAVNDVVSVNYDDEDLISGTWQDVKITARTSTTFSFELPVAPNPAFDFVSLGNVFVSTSSRRFILSQDKEPGTIINAEDIVSILVLNTDNS